MSESVEAMRDQGLAARETNRDRVTQFLESFEPARKLAEENGMRLTNPSTGCYQLSRSDPDWLYNLYPKVNGHVPRVWVDPKHPSPFLTLPYQWDLLDVVKSVLFMLGEVVE